MKRLNGNGIIQQHLVDSISKIRGPRKCKNENDLLMGLFFL